MKIPRSLPPAGTRPFDVVGFGENSFDLVAVLPQYPQPNTKVAIDRLEQLPGGQVATAMAACARLGWRARYVGRFGGDTYGALGIESLEREGVDTAYAERVAGATSHLALVIVSGDHGHRTVMWHEHPDLSMQPDAVPIDPMLDGRVLLVDATQPVVSARAAAAARRAGIVTVVDVEAVRPGVDALLEHIDVIIAAEAFPSAITGVPGTGEALAALGDRFPGTPVVCVTLGEEGSLARCAGREVRTPGFSVPCVDSTGAGDVFRAGFIAGWLRAGDGAGLEEVLRYANAAAALSCRAVGARGALPGPPEVEVLLHSK